MAGEAGRRGHHHGNARHALIEAATDMLEATGAAALSLRGIAERAGLSRQAPYNHFDDKESLLAALVVTGFDRLAAEVRVAASTSRGETALARAGEAYIAFAQEAPALFRLMFSRELVDQSRFPDAVEAGANAFGALAAIVSQIVPAGHVDDVSLAAWSIVHGYATLCIETGLEPPDRVGGRSRQFARLIASSSKDRARLAVDPD